MALSLLAAAAATGTTAPLNTKLASKAVGSLAAMTKTTPMDLQAPQQRPSRELHECAAMYQLVGDSVWGTETCKIMDATSAIPSYECKGLTGGQLKWNAETTTTFAYWSNDVTMVTIPVATSNAGVAGEAFFCPDAKSWRDGAKVTVDISVYTGAWPPASSVAPEAAPCFGDTTSATLVDGQRILMRDLKAGDFVLPGPTRVIVNQHKAAHLESTLLKVDHAQGSISLTPDHVLNVDGSFVAARHAVVGSKLGDSHVSRVTSSVGGIINPLTVSGMIIADGVLASTYPEWIASYMLGRSTASMSSLISFLFPASTQAYYDAHLEHLFHSSFSSLETLATHLPAPLIALTMVLIDVLVAAGFFAFSLSSVQSLVALVALVAALKPRIAK